MDVEMVIAAITDPHFKLSWSHQHYMLKNV